MLGDVTGIGPELCAKILASGAHNHLARLVVFGDARVLELGMRDAGVHFMYSKYADISAVVLSPDGSKVAFTRDTATVNGGYDLWLVATTAAA